MQTNGILNSNGTSVSIRNYEPRPIAASTVKAVATPANNPSYYREFARRQKDRLRRNRGIEQARGMMLPGSKSTQSSLHVPLLTPLQLDLQVQTSICDASGHLRVAFWMK
jgi:chromatin structure-remodeling complex subunit RSC9